MKSCHYGSSCGHKQGKSVLSYPPGKHANLKTNFTARLCGKTRLDATHFVQPPSCPTTTSTPTFPHHNNEKSKKTPHFLSFNPPFLSFNPKFSSPSAATDDTGKQKAPGQFQGLARSKNLSEFRDAAETYGNAGSTSAVPDDPACYDGSSW